MKLALDAVIVLVVVAIAVVGFRYFTRRPEAPAMDFMQRKAVVLEFVFRDLLVATAKATAEPG